MRIRTLLLALALGLATTLTGSSLCTAQNGCGGFYGCKSDAQCGWPCVCVQPRTGGTPRCVGG